VAETDNLYTLLVTSSVEFLVHGKECVLNCLFNLRVFSKAAQKTCLHNVL